MHADPDITVETRVVETSRIALNVATAGAGPPVLLVHGWPHTWRVWSRVIPTLARARRVVAPDLRGLGASQRTVEGYDAASLAADLGALLDALEIEEPGVIAIDAGVPPAFLLALDGTPVSELVLIESLLGGLPGAEGFAPPWWFGFHAVPGLAERVLVGHEDAYVDFFLQIGTVAPDGVPADIRDAFVEAYTGTDALRAGFALYRSFGVNAEQIAEAASRRRLAAPTLAIGAASVGDVLHRQLASVTDDLTGVVLADCGHIVALDRPDALLRAIDDWRDARRTTGDGSQ